MNNFAVTHKTLAKDLKIALFQSSTTVISRLEPDTIPLKYFRIVTAGECSTRIERYSHDNLHGRVVNSGQRPGS